jgi:hypothetical protein
MTGHGDAERAYAAPYPQRITVVTTVTAAPTSETGSGRRVMIVSFMAVSPFRSRSLAGTSVRRRRSRHDRRETLPRACRNRVVGSDSSVEACGLTGRSAHEEEKR